MLCDNELRKRDKAHIYHVGTIWIGYLGRFPSLLLQHLTHVSLLILRKTKEANTGPKEWLQFEIGDLQYD